MNNTVTFDEDACQQHFLCAAIYTNNIPVVESLLTKGLSPVVWEGEIILFPNPAYLAARQGNKTIIKMFLERSIAKHPSVGHALAPNDPVYLNRLWAIRGAMEGSNTDTLDFLLGPFLEGLTSPKRRDSKIIETLLLGMRRAEFPLFLQIKSVVDGGGPEHSVSG
jgi:hypothetical protein